MTSIRVSQLPSNVTEKHIKVYFSNPRNGGGRVAKILYPLTYNSAIITFDDEAVVSRLLKSQEHQIMNTDISLAPLPKQVFRKVVTEVEPRVSLFMLENPNIVDELKIIGEVDIQLRESKQQYFLTGSWYQMEWALQYLDTMQDTFGYDAENLPAASRDSHRNVPVFDGKEKVSCGSAPREFEIKHPNIPLAKSPEEQARQQMTSYNQAKPGQRSTENAAEGCPVASAGKKKNKNKNMGPASKATEQNDTTDPNLAGNSVFESGASNEEGLNDAHYFQKRPPNADFNQNRFDSSDDENATHIQSGAHGFRPAFNPADYGGYESDSEGEANFGRRVYFAPDTNFDENRGRPVRMFPSYHQFPEKTKGIDVSDAYFGATPLDMSFDVGKHVKVHVAKDDITRQTTDAIVNPTNARLTHTMSAVSRAIVSSAGVQMQLECEQYLAAMGDLGVAKVINTSAGGALNNKVGLILHAHGPQWQEDDSDLSTHMLVCTYLNCFMYADQNLWLQSLATPLINTGVYGFPLDVSIQAFFDALLLFAINREQTIHLKDIYLICFDQDTAMAAITITRSLLDCDIAQAEMGAADRYLMRKMSFDFEAEYFSLHGGNGDKQAADDTKDRPEDAENSDPLLEEGTDELSRNDDNSKFEDSNTNMKKGGGDTGNVKFEDLAMEEKKPQDEGKREEKLLNVAHTETQDDTNSENKSVARRLELALAEMQQKGNQEGWQDDKEADNLQKPGALATVSVNINTDDDQVSKFKTVAKAYEAKGEVEDSDRKADDKDADNLQKPGALATVSVNINTDDDQVSKLNTAAKAYEAKREVEDSDRKADRDAFVLAADENNEETSERETKNEDQDLTKQPEDIPDDRKEAEVVRGLVEQRNERSADAEGGSSNEDEEDSKEDEGNGGTSGADQKYEDENTDLDRQQEEPVSLETADDTGDSLEKKLEYRVIPC